MASTSNESKVVNFWVMVALLDPLSPHSADEELADEQYEGADEETIRMIIRQRVVPCFSRVSEESKSVVKHTLMYYMTFDAQSIANAFEANNPVFSLPDNPSDFFFWLWDELFPNQDFHAKSEQDYVVNHGFDIANKVCNGMGASFIQR